MSTSFSDFTSLVADLMTILVSGVGFVTYLRNRKKLNSVFRHLLNFSLQLALSDLKHNVERLNDYNAANVDHHDYIRNIFHEIIGQIRGNPKLEKLMSDTCNRVEVFATGKKLDEPKKRALTSELRERLRHAHFDEMADTEAGDE